MSTLGIKTCDKMFSPFSRQGDPRNKASCLTSSHTLSISAAYFLACLLSMNPSTLVLSQSTRSEPEAQKHRRITQLKHHDQGVYQQHSEYEAYIKYMSKINQLTWYKNGQHWFSVFSLRVSNPIYILAFRVSSRKKNVWLGGSVQKLHSKSTLWLFGGCGSLHFAN